MRVLNHVTWNPLASFAHPATLAGPASVVAYSEVEEDTGRTLAAANQVGGKLLGRTAGLASMCTAHTSIVGVGGGARGTY